MKKLLVLILAVVMISALFACGDKNAAQTPASQSPSAPSSSAPASSPPPSSGGGFTVPTLDLGDFDDPFSRDPYKIAYIIPMKMPIHQVMEDAYIELGKIFNYELSAFDHNDDTDAYFTTIEIAAGQDYNAMIVETQYATQARVFNILSDRPDIVLFPGFSPYVDANNNPIAPGVTFDSYNRGKICMEYVLDNFSSHTGGSVDLKDVGIITLRMGGVDELVLRMNGYMDVYRAKYPDIGDSNFFDLDVMAETSAATPEAAYNLVSATVAANSQYKGWLLHGTVEDWADGGRRALEDLGLGNVSMATSDSANLILDLWDNGYDGCWIGGVDTPMIQNGHATILGILQLLEGRATKETLWPQHRAPGQTYTVFMLPHTMVTKDMYVAYRDFTNKYVEIVFK